MTGEEIEAYRKKVADILKGEGPEKRQKLLALAGKVGASTSNWARIGADNDATESQLVDNIQRAIQTASMVDMCRSSATMCQIAARNYKIALVAAIIAALSALVAWVAVLARQGEI